MKQLSLTLIPAILLASMGCTSLNKTPEPATKVEPVPQTRNEIPKLNTPTSRLHFEDINEENYAAQIKVLEGELSRDRQALNQQAKKPN
ncbi:MAG: hypothetical protein N2112_09140 [Gemmataceae bacterium]|jgi:hypothetical protein|nr:hypothetical protein [Gemmataceae bacterium]